MVNGVSPILPYGGIKKQRTLPGLFELGGHVSSQLGDKNTQYVQQKDEVHLNGTSAATYVRTTPNRTQRNATQRKTTQDPVETQLHATSGAARHPALNIYLPGYHVQVLPTGS